MGMDRKLERGRICPKLLCGMTPSDTMFVVDAKREEGGGIRARVHSGCKSGIMEREGGRMREEADPCLFIDVKGSMWHDRDSGILSEVGGRIFVPERRS